MGIEPKPRPRRPSRVADGAGAADTGEADDAAVDLGDEHRLETWLGAEDAAPALRPVRHRADVDDRLRHEAGVRLVPGGDVHSSDRLGIGEDGGTDERDGRHWKLRR